MFFFCVFFFTTGLLDNPLGQLTRRLLGIQAEGYTYMASLRRLSMPPSHQSPLTNWPPCPTPICIPLLAYYLRYHPDQEYVSFILQGLQVGFHVGFAGAQISLRSSSRNHPSSLANPQAIRNFIHEETSAGRMVGPLNLPLEGLIHCSPIGLVPKGRGTGQWRMIVDLSHPDCRSVNDGIPSHLCSVNYSAVDEALCFIKQLGRNTMLVKVDLKGAYRMVLLHPQDRHLFGITWEDQVYADQALPFGLCSAPKIFTAVADAVGWALLESGIPYHIHYLDDFLFFIPTAQEGEVNLPRILNVFSSLGVPVATHKIEGPATQVTFLGVIVDTARFELRLPLDKLEYTRSLVRSWRGRRSGRYKEFESLLGHLSHAATVIRQGRIFLRHLFTVLKAARSTGHFVHLDTTSRADLLWWEYFLVHWNGTMFLQCAPTPSYHVYTDASGSFGCGGILLSSSWLQLRWPESWADVNIAVKELVPIVVAAAIWGRQWYLHHVRFHSDNMAVVAILRTRSTRDAAALHLLRCLYFYTAYFQFEYTVEHVPGVLNTAADAISRDNITLFSSLFPQATQATVPQPLLNLLISQRPDWGSPRWTALFTDTLSIL